MQIMVHMPCKSSLACEGPEASPKVSPVIAALCASLPFPPCAPDSMSFLQLSNAPAQSRMRFCVSSCILQKPTPDCWEHVQGGSLYHAGSPPAVLRNSAMRMPALAAHNMFVSYLND